MSKILKFILLGLLSLTLIVILFAAWGMNQLKNSEAYKVAINQINSMPTVQEATGGIDGYGWYIEGFVKENSQTDSANFLLTVKGRKKDIDILCLMGKNEDGQWIVKNYKVL